MKLSAYFSKIPRISRLCPGNIFRTPQYKYCTAGKGFTLIELLVVMGVLGTLAAGLVIVINPAGTLAKARDAERKSDLVQIQRALETYYDDHSSYPSQLSDLSSSTARYIQEVPNDPVPSNFDYHYMRLSNGQQYRLYSHLENDSDIHACPGVRCINSPNNACASGSGSGQCRFGVSSPNTSP